MKINFFILLLFLAVAQMNATLTGNAFLSGQVNHSGIKVKFIANAGTAITDSTFTNSNGLYSINISGGIYTIVFSKTGFQNAFYSNNSSIVLTNTMALANVTLIPGNVVSVSGNVSGNWTNNNIYLVSSDITIPLSTTLNIQAGTVVKFNGGFSLTANGVLNASGSPTNKILITSNLTPATPGDWRGIYVNNSQCIVKNCIIEFALRSLWIEQSSPLIEENELRKFSGIGIGMYYSSNATIKNNSIHDFTGTGISCYNSDPWIECNSVYNGEIAGIVVANGGTIKNNHVYNIRDYGIACYYIATSRIENNVIHDCKIGIKSGETVGSGPKPLIINNTIYNNFQGVLLQNIAGATIIGNIIVTNTTGIVTANCWTCLPLVSHNLVWNNVTNYNVIEVLGLGQITNTNVNGNAVDSYFNLSQDPLFINASPPFYSPNSPCVNAGDNNYSPNVGCNTGSICSSIVLAVKEFTGKTELLVFPNPFISSITASNINPGMISTIRLIDIMGKSNEVVIETVSYNSVNIKTDHFAPGIYFLEIRMTDSSKKYLRVIKE